MVLTICVITILPYQHSVSCLLASIVFLITVIRQELVLWAFWRSKQFTWDSSLGILGLAVSVWVYFSVGLSLKNTCFVYRISTILSWFWFRFTGLWLDWLASSPTGTTLVSQTNPPANTPASRELGQLKPHFPSTCNKKSKQSKQ